MKLTNHNQVDEYNQHSDTETTGWGLYSTRKTADSGDYWREANNLSSVCVIPIRCYMHVLSWSPRLYNGHQDFRMSRLSDRDFRMSRLSDRYLCSDIKPPTKLLMFHF